jgi:hypothetical protein
MASFQKASYTIKEMSGIPLSSTEVLILILKSALTDQQTTSNHMNRKIDTFQLSSKLINMAIITSLMN